MGGGGNNGVEPMVAGWAAVAAAAAEGVSEVTGAEWAAGMVVAAAVTEGVAWATVARAVTEAAGAEVVPAA
eukprot:4969645-Prymnesium_polylepis.1